MSKPNPLAFRGWLRTPGGWQCVCSGSDAVTCWMILLERPEAAPRAVLPAPLRARDGHCLQCGNVLPPKRPWTRLVHCSVACAHVRNNLRNNAGWHLRRRRKEKARGSR